MNKSFLEQPVHIKKESADEECAGDIKNLLIKHWGSTNMVTKGKVIDTTQIARLVVRAPDNQLVGLLTYLVDTENQSCEMVSVNSELEGRGIGTKLLAMAETEAKEKGCTRIWLITTNDNPEAAAFYVKRGYRLTKVHLDALEKSRQLKPQISAIGKHGIPLLDEWEFEKKL